MEIGRKILLSLTIGLFAVSANCKNITLPTRHTHEFVLENGLKLIVRQDKRAPVVSTYTWYRVGSADEPGGITGISHVLEHMMFKGTPKHPQGEFSEIIARHGGKENAFTSSDYTAYYQELSADQLALSFQLEADRMQNLVFEHNAFQKELNVVREERRMRVDDNPNAVLYERFNAAANLAHPYHHMTIGWMEDLQQMRLAEVKRWYQQWYAPNNAVVVVVGDVTPANVYRLAKQYFGSIPSKVLPVRKQYREPKAISSRRLTVRIPARLPIVLIGYNVPSLRTAQQPQDVYALHLLDGLLSAGNSARIARELIRGKQIASHASSNYDIYRRYDTLFMLEGTPTANYSSTELENALRQQIKALQKNPVSPRELKRIKTQMIANHVYENDSLSAQAMRIGALVSNGIAWQEIDNYAQRIQAITPKQIQLAAQRYLTDNRLTVATLVPITASSAKKQSAVKEGAYHAH